MSISQERELLSRLLVVAKSRHEFDVKDAIGEYEFAITPPSNFHPDGSMIMLPGKSQALQSILKLPLPGDKGQLPIDVSTSATEVLIIDGMCVVNMVTKSHDKFTAQHFATKFMDIADSLGKSYSEIRLVFDQYLCGSLKETTRNKRTKKSNSLYYNVHDTTEI